MIYIVTLKSDGTEVFRYDADAPIEWPGMEFATHEHAAFVPPPPPPPSPAIRRITKLAFRNRFTQAEKATIELAALDNPSASIGQRQMAASLRASMKDQEVAQYVDLERADTRAATQGLESAGLIGAGRALQILDGPILSHEVWNG